MPRQKPPLGDRACFGILFGRRQAEAFQYGRELLSRAGHDGGEFCGKFESRGASFTAAFGDFPAEAFGKVSPHRAGPETDIALRIELAFGPLAVQRKGAGPLRSDAAGLAGLARLQNGDHALRRRLLGVRNVRGNAAGAESSRFHRFALLWRDLPGSLVLTKVHCGATLEQLESKASRHALKFLAGFPGFQFRVRRKHSKHLSAEPFFNSFQRSILAVIFGVFSADQFKAWGEPVGTWLEARNLGLFPGDGACVRQGESFGRGTGNLSEAFGQDWPKRCYCGSPYSLAFQRLRCRCRLELQAYKFADDMALDGYFSSVGQFSHKKVFPFQPSQQGRRSAVNKAQCEGGVKGI